MPSYATPEPGRRGLALSGLALAAALAAGLSSGAAQAEKRIVATIPFYPASGWSLTTDDAFILTQAGCMETLTTREADGSLVPTLAESWNRHSPTEWDFKIRPGVAFQDGTPLTGQVVVDDLNALLTAAAPPRSFRPKSISSVTLVDEMTVRIATPSPSVLVPFRMAAPNTGILSPAALKGDTTNPVGTCTGPFEIVEDVPQQSISLKRNEAYWGGDVVLDTAELRFIPDGPGRATQLKTGEAQISTRMPVTDALSLESNPDVVISRIPQPRTTSLYMNTKKAPFDNERFRQAVQSAIDAATIAATLYEGAAQPAGGPFAAGDPWAPDDVAPVARDLDKAKALLADSGADASVKLQLLTYTSRPELPDLATIVQAQLTELGLNVELRIAEYGALEPDLIAGNFDMLLLSRGYLSDVADPIGMLTADYACDGGYNLSQFCDPEVDGKINAAAAAESAEERYALYKDVASELQARAVSVFLVHPERIDGVLAGVKNYSVHPDGYLLLTPELDIE